MVATAAAFVVLGEPVTVVQILGGLVAVLAIGVICSHSARMSSAAD